MADLARVKARAKEEVDAAKASAKGAIQAAKASAKKAQASGSVQAVAEGAGVILEAVAKKKAGDAYKYLPVVALATELYCYYKGSEKPSAMLMDVAAAARGARMRATITLADELVSQII